MYLRIPLLIAVLATRVLPAMLVLIVPASIVAWAAGFWPMSIPGMSSICIPGIEPWAWPATESLLPPNPWASNTAGAGPVLGLCRSA